MGGHQTRPAPLPEGPPAMARWIFLKEVLQAFGAMMVLLPLAALGLFIVLTVFL